MRISDWSSDVCSSDLPPPLMVLLVERAGVDPEPDRDLAGGKRVLPHRIMDAVGERAEGPGLVAWNIAAAVEPVRVAGGMDRHRDEDEKKGEIGRAHV